MSACTNLGLVDAFHLWASGMRLENYCIDGYSAVWIGRLARLLALLGSVPIIIDIFGEDRIHAATRHLKDVLRQLIGRYRIFPLRERAKRYLGPENRRRVIKLLAFIFFLVIEFIYPAVWTRGGPVSAWIPGMMDASVPEKILIAFLIGLLVTALVFIALHLLVMASILCALAIMELALIVLPNDALCRVIRVYAVAMLITAFFLDLFVSS